VRRAAAALSLALWALAPREARGDQTKSFRAFDGTTRHATALQASLINAKVFGAVRALDRLIIRPGISGPLQWGYEVNYLYSAVNVPGLEEGGRYVLAPVDLTAHNLAVQLCTSSDREAFAACAFYSSSVTAGFLPSDGNDRFVLFFGGLTMPLAGHLVAPLSVAGVTQARTGLTSFQFSVIAGGTLRVGDWLSARGGVVGAIEQRGFYGNVYSDKTKLFATAALTDGFGDLATFLAGLDQLVLPVGEARDVARTIGATTLYARQARFVVPQLAQDVRGTATDLTGRFDLWTAHFEQLNIADAFDVMVAYAVKPTPLLHQLMLGVHSPKAATVVRTREGQGFVGASGGVVSLPNLPFYGIEGGRRFAFSIEGGAASKDFGAKVAVRLNDPEVLTYFPFAQNSLNFYLTLHGGSGGP
jgi:hypothetical protein